MFSVVAPLMIGGAFGCSIVLPQRPVFGRGLSLGPHNGDWLVTVDGATMMANNILIAEPVPVDGAAAKVANDTFHSDELTPLGKEFLVNDSTGASLPLDKIAVGDFANAEHYLFDPLRPDFAGQYFKVDFPHKLNEGDLEGHKIVVYESEDKVIGEYMLPWAPRKEGEFIVLTATPHAVGYWSSVTREQVYVLEQAQEFGPSLLHVLDLDDGSWFEPTEFDGAFGSQGGLTQLKSLDQFGIVESMVPSFACGGVEWISFDAEGNTKSITQDPIYGDAGFDFRGNLLKTQFDSIFIYRAPEYKEELVAEYTDVELVDALKGPLRCSEAKRDCPGFKSKSCGFEQTMLKFAGATKSKAKGKFDSCGCESACADKGAEYWTLKKSSGRCVCYTGGKPKRVVRGLAFISSHDFHE